MHQLIEHLALAGSVWQEKKKKPGYFNDSIGVKSIATEESKIKGKLAVSILIYKMCLIDAAYIVHRTV